MLLATSFSTWRASARRQRGAAQQQAAVQQAQQVAAAYTQLSEKAADEKLRTTRLELRRHAQVTARLAKCLSSVRRRCFVEWRELIRRRRVGVKAIQKLRNRSVARCMASWRANAEVHRRERAQAEARAQRAELSAAAGQLRQREEEAQVTAQRLALRQNAALAVLLERALFESVGRWVVQKRAATARALTSSPSRRASRACAAVS